MLRAKPVLVRFSKPQSYGSGQGGGNKLSHLTDDRGGALSLVVAGSNVQYAELIAMTLERAVVMGALAWLSECLAALMRYDKKAPNYIGLPQLACARLWNCRQYQPRI